MIKGLNKFQLIQDFTNWLTLKIYNSQSVKPKIANEYNLESLKGEVYKFSDTTLSSVQKLL